MQLDFVVPGFSKCGTTTLCSLLAQHPDIFIPEIKEPNFFAFNYWRGWEWYAGLFRDTDEASVLGEGSTFYTAAKFEQQACSRIAHHFPHVRLIFIARHPIARLESSFREHHHSGHKYGIDAPFSIGEALRALPNIIDDTLYWQRLNAYRSRFPDEQIHVLFLEDLKSDPQAELARCFRFLGVDPDIEIGRSNRRLNPGQDKLYDSRWMRFVRRHRFANSLWRRLNATNQDRIGGALGWRKPFREPIRWERQDRLWAVRCVADDARRLLEYGGKPLDFWRLDGEASQGNTVGRERRAA